MILHIISLIREMTDPYAGIKAMCTWWDIRSSGNDATLQFHHVISLVTSQEVAFAKGRQIREALYAYTTDHILTPELVRSLTHEQLQQTGLSASRIETVKQLAALDDHKSLDAVAAYAKISGVGPWTIKGVKILCGLDDHVILHEDRWIRKRLAELIGRSGEVTQAEAKQLFEQWKGHESLMSMFLWRIKPSGIQKWRSGTTLTKDDFIQRQKKK